MNPPDNPKAEQARADMREYNAAIKPQPKRMLYPLDEKRPIWIVNCQDDGIEIRIDDPASLGIDTPLSSAARRE